MGQGKDSENTFEKTCPDVFTYFRYPICDFMTVWSKDPKRKIEAKNNARDTTENLFQFIDTSLEQGESVLIHCAAGMHRAGATTVLFLMHTMNCDYENALKEAQFRRPVINPTYDPLLVRL